MKDLRKMRCWAVGQLVRRLRLVFFWDIDDKHKAQFAGAMVAGSGGAFLDRPERSGAEV